MTERIFVKILAKEFGRFRNFKGNDMKKITIHVGKKIYEIGSGAKVIDFINDCCPDKKNTVYAAYINNIPHSLNYLLQENNIQLDPVFDDSSFGQLIYKRSLSFLLHRTIFELYRNSRIVLGTSIGNSYYYDFYSDIPVNETLLKEIAKKMREFISNQEIFEQYNFKKEDAVNYLKKRGYYNKMKLVEQLDLQYVSIYSSGPYKDFDLGPLVPHAGYLKNFWLKRYNQGFLLCFLSESQKENYLIQVGKKRNVFKIFSESKEWGKIIEINNVRRLNEVIMEKRAKEIVNICEGFHEKKIAKIADQITDRYRKKSLRLILVAGPSSSGKTTFTQRLAIHLKINGLNPVFISLDNYYIDREKTPKDENGNYDFENILALDLQLLNKHLNELIKGNEIGLPFFDFETGKRKEKRVPLRIDEYQPIIMEGIHGLNPLLTSDVTDDLKYKIYISALTPIAVDDYNRIPSSDNRLIRRLVRDYKFRGYSAAQTIKMWPNVRKGEEKYIFPFQELADVSFNSAHHYELAVLKQDAESILNMIPRNSEEYQIGYRLLNFLSIFKAIEKDIVPFNSILREFLGGSCFSY